MCVPCQVIIWNGDMTAMANAVTEFAKLKIAGSKAGWPSDEWGSRWYKVVDEACGKMKPLLDELTGIKS